MKHTLRNRPKCEDTTDVRCMECAEWFEGFEKELHIERDRLRKSGDESSDVVERIVFGAVASKLSEVLGDS